MRNEMWEELSSETYMHLCECRSALKEVPELARAVYHYKKKKNPKYSPDDALIYTFEHLESNGQDFLEYISDERYKRILKEVV